MDVWESERTRYLTHGSGQRDTSEAHEWVGGRQESGLWCCVNGGLSILLFCCPALAQATMGEIEIEGEGEGEREKKKKQQ